MFIKIFFSLWLFFFPNLILRLFLASKVNFFNFSLRLFFKSARKIPFKTRLKITF